MDIFDPSLFPGIDVYSAGDSRESPEILVLEVSSVAPAEDFKSDYVLAFLHRLGYVEAGLELAVLAVADLLSVHPNPDIGCRGADTEAYLLSDPGLVNSEGSSVLSHIIVLRCGIGRVCLVVPSPCITNVHVERVSVTVEFQHSGDRNLIP